MELLLTSLILTAIVVFVIPIALLRAEIRRHHRIGALTRQPRSLSAAITRRACGLYIRTPATHDNSDRRRCRPWPTSDREERRAP